MHMLISCTQAVLLRGPPRAEADPSQCTEGRGASWMTFLFRCVDMRTERKQWGWEAGWDGGRKHPDQGGQLADFCWTWEPEATAPLRTETQERKKAGAEEGATPHVRGHAAVWPGAP